MRGQAAPPRVASLESPGKDPDRSLRSNRPSDCIQWARSVPAPSDTIQDEPPKPDPEQTPKPPQQQPTRPNPERGTAPCGRGGLPGKGPSLHSNHSMKPRALPVFHGPACCHHAVRCGNSRPPTLLLVPTQNASTDTFFVNVFLVSFCALSSFGCPCLQRLLVVEQKS